MPRLDWVTLTTGQLSRNIFRGEDINRVYRNTVATTTLIRDGERVILVDPSLPVAEMEARLAPLGLCANDIDVVFCTHGHCDHMVDASRYPNAVRYMPARDIADLAALNQKVAALKLPYKIDGPECFAAAPEMLTPQIRVVPLPGHTMGLSGLLFETEKETVLVGGDAVMTAEHLAHCSGHFNSADEELARRSIRKAQACCDVLIPGHDGPIRLRTPTT